MASERAAGEMEDRIKGNECGAITAMNIIEWLKEHGEKDNILAPSMDAQTAVNFLCDYLLGDDFCIMYPASNGQANTEIVCEILQKYSKRLRKEIRAKKKNGNDCGIRPEEI